MAAILKTAVLSTIFLLLSPYALLTSAPGYRGPDVIRRREVRHALGAAAIWPRRSGHERCSFSASSVDFCAGLHPRNSPGLVLGPHYPLPTGSYIGEGFDDSRLDTLFLAMPISWRGTLQQYVGRLHRLHDSKKVVEVCYYVDSSIPMVARMFDKRLRGYKALGYAIHSR